MLLYSSEDMYKAKIDESKDEHGKFTHDNMKKPVINT